MDQIELKQKLIERLVARKPKKAEVFEFISTLTEEFSPSLVFYGPELAAYLLTFRLTVKELEVLVRCCHSSHALELLMKHPQGKQYYPELISLKIASPYYEMIWSELQNQLMGKFKKDQYFCINLLENVVLFADEPYRNRAWNLLQNYHVSEDYEEDYKKALCIIMARVPSLIDPIAELLLGYPFECSYMVYIACFSPTLRSKCLNEIMSYTEQNMKRRLSLLGYSISETADIMKFYKHCPEDVFKEVMLPLFEAMLKEKPYHGELFGLYRGVPLLRPRIQEYLADYDLNSYDSWEYIQMVVKNW